MSAFVTAVRPPTLATALTAALLLAALAFASTASARTFTVTLRGDPVPNGCKPNDCSLREAVMRANERAGRDVIALPNRRAPYFLKQAGSGEDGALDGDLDVSNHPLVIRHPGSGRAAIVARGTGERVFEVFDGAPTTFRKLVIRGGEAPSGEGGGIRSDANLRVIRSRIVGNRSDDSHGGGIGLEDDAGLRLIRSVVARNRAASDGGGIDGDEARVVIMRSRIARNRAEGSGGGLYHLSASSSRIVASTVDRNRAGNQGGGIYHTGIRRLLLVRTTVSRNRGDYGGGVNADSDGALSAVNVTVALNRADTHGGGIYRGDSSANARLNAVTVARNVADADADGNGTGGGLYRDLANLFRVENALVGLNTLGSGGRNDCDGGQPLDSRGGNVLSSRGPAGACQGFNRPTDRVRGNPRIGGLRRNGGPTETIALRAGSIAINRAKGGTAPPRDQRGKRRGPRKDVGAFERRVGR